MPSAENWESPDQKLLWRAFTRSVRANVLAEVATQCIRIGGFIVLARALAPAEFGLLRILIAITLLAGLTCSVGIPDALIQHRELSSEHEKAAWWANLAIAAVTALVLYSAAPLLAQAMGEPTLTTSLRVLCLPLFLDSTASIANARLRRRLDFAPLARADVVAEAAFLTTALALLFLGLPRWSLVGALAARLVARAATIWSAERYVPSGIPRLAPLRELLPFAFSVWGGRALVTASGNADYLLIGRTLGSSVLGYYVMAWDLLRFIPDRLYGVVGRVSLPTFARLQHDDAALRRAYRDFGGYIARVVLPMLACTAVAAPQLVEGLYGAHWLPAAIPLRLLSFGLALAGLRLAIGPIYYTKNHPSFDIWLHGFRLILIVVAITLSSQFGLFGVSAAMSGVEATVSILGQILACWLISLGGVSLVRAWLPGLRIACFCAVASGLGVMLARAGDLHGAMALPAIALPPAVLFLWLQAATVREMLARLFERPAVA
jgi:polysaccharide transporter, PST family